MMTSTSISRRPGATVAAAAFALILNLTAGLATAQPQAPAASGRPPNAGTDPAAASARKLPIKEALQQEFLREQGRPADKIQWFEIEQGEAALTALRRSLIIKSTKLNKDLSAAAFQQALALFDPVLSQSLTYNRSVVYNRTATDLEFKAAITCVAGVCTRTLGNNPGVFSLTFDEGRNAGFFQTQIDASVASDTGADKTKAYNAQISKLFRKGISAFAADSLIYKNSMFVEDIGFKVIGSYGRPWTNQFNAGISAPLPGSKFFGDYAVADVAVKIADINQQAAFWQIAALINDTLLQVEQGYWNLVLGKKIYEVTVETRERVRALAEKTERLFRLQEATRYDKAKVDAQLATLRRQEREALNNYVAASNALANLLDLGKDMILLPTRYESKIQESESIDLQNALQQGVARSPLVRLAEVNKNISVILHEQSRVQLRPDLSAAATINKSQSNAIYGHRTAPQALGHAFHPDSTNQTYSLNYTRPWDNRAANANFLQAESRFRQQEILLDRTRRTVSSQITLAVTNLQSAQQRTEIAKRSRDLAEEVFKRAERQRALGVVSDFELIAKSIDLLNADLDYQTALLGRKILEAAVYAAMGSLAQRYGEGSGK